MSKIIIPQNYHSPISLIDTEIAIKIIKDTFEQELAKNLKLTRISAPLFLLKNTGLNDNLSGKEEPVSFTSYELNKNDEIEIIHSLAKWKRDALYRYQFKTHTGLYTDMNAIRKDEELDNIHSIYVDQWDWEIAIDKQDRTLDYFKKIVTSIYHTLTSVEAKILKLYPSLNSSILPKDIHFITSQELEDLYPNDNAKIREAKITKTHKAVCIMQIGESLKSGLPHDYRAPDYDDWSLNGDILVWNPILEDALELSSMGIRVDSEILKLQLEKANASMRLNLPYHQNVIHQILPLSIGGGIGQSRLCMFILQKAHIGEVQASLWDQQTLMICKKNHIDLL